MFSFQAAQRSAKPQRASEPEHGAFQRVAINLQGRLMVSNHDEYTCTVVDMSPGDASFECFARPIIGERVVAYIDHLGRLEGKVTEVLSNGFAMSIQATERKREKLAAQLTWIANRHELGLPEDRRHDRLMPRNTLSELTLGDGRRLVCRIMDLSLSGAAVDVEQRPPIDTPVRLGSMQGRVVRHFMEGIAIEFSSVQTRESLREFL